MAQSLGTDSRRRWWVAAILAQVVLGGALIALVTGSRWLADDIGVVTVGLGVAGLIGAGALWWRTGQALPLIIVDLWFLVYGLILVGPYRDVYALDVGPQDDQWKAIAALGGPQLVVALVWVVAGAFGSIALVRSRRMRSSSLPVSPDRRAASPRR